VFGVGVDHLDVRVPDEPLLVHLLSPIWNLMYVNINVSTYISVYVNIYINMYISTYINIYVYVYTYIYIYI
jgi:hypothetical protein